MIRSISLVVLAFASVATLSEGAVFQGLGTQNTTFHAEGLSSDGSTVFGASGSQSFRWPLSETPEYFAGMHNESAISAGGIAIVGRYKYDEYTVVIPPFNDFHTVSLYEARVYSAAAQSVVSLGFLDSAANIDHSASATAVSADGSVIFGSSTSSSGPRAFRWTAASGMVPLPRPDEFPDRNFRSVFDVSADGNTAIGVIAAPLGGYDELGIWRADAGTSLWTNPDGSTLGWLPSPIALSADGTAAAGERMRLNHFRPQAWRWTEDDGQEFLVPTVNNPSTDSSHAFGISSDGSIVVGTMTQGGRTGPMIWDEENGARFLEDYFRLELGLDLAGWSLDDIVGYSGELVGMSDDGQVFFGRATNPDGGLEFWLVTPSALAGDYNGDNVVNAADYVVWRNTLGQTVDIGTGADGSGPLGAPDGLVDRFDFDFWKAHYGQPNGSGAAESTIAVPEPAPASMILLTISIVAISTTRRTSSASASSAW